MQDKVEIYLYNFFYNGLGIHEFEQWVYQSNELKSILNEDDYLALISLDYKSRFSKHEIEKILERYIDYGKFETRKMLSLLYDALNKSSDTGEILRTFYDLYCCGYYFLQDLGLGYGLTCEVPPAKYKAESWDELSERDKKDILESFMPQLTDDIRRAIDWLENKRIILTGTKNEIDHWTFIDNRTNEEKKSTVWVKVEKNKKTGASVSKIILHKIQTKNWWKFWK